MNQISVVIAGGGTAGHIEPALAVGEALRHNHGARITALGTPKGLEGDIIPSRGVELAMITPVPIPRKFNVDLALLPFRLVKAVSQARKVLKDTGAHAVFGTGGYVAGPAYLAAKSLGLPFFVLETNALAGIANKLGVKLGGVGWNASAGSGMPGDVVGIPVRANLQDPAAAERGRQLWNLSPKLPVLLVTGGSQGAQSINAAVAGGIDKLTQRFQVLHAFGPRNEAPAPQDNYVPVPYIDDMAAALAVADVTVCRAGAMTVAEVSAAGLPAVYVPLPHGNGEQALNCRQVVDAGGARQIDDQDLTPQRLVETVNEAYDKRDELRAAVAGSAAGDVAGKLANRIVAAVNARQGKDA